jgi:hypothetical protein
VLLGIGVFVATELGAGLSDLFHGRARLGPPTAVTLGLARIVLFLSPFAVLSYGLARRRRWAWFGSVAFAVVLTVFWTVIELTDPSGPGWKLDGTVSERIGGTAGQAIFPLASLSYAVLLYRSRAVRAFLCVGGGSLRDR